MTLLSERGRGANREPEAVRLEGEHPSERRSEPRFPTHDLVEVACAPAGGMRVPAVVMDASWSGLRLEINTPVRPGEQVIITFPDELIVLGEVRYSQAAGTSWHAGVLIEKVLHSSPESDRHLYGVELCRLLSGQGLTAAEVIVFGRHLGQCESCRDRLEGAKVVQPPVLG